MVCKKCNSEWKTDGRISASLTACPFCGESLADEMESKARLFDTSKDALLFIAKEHGNAALLGKTLRSLFPDYAPQVSKNRKDLVNAVYDKGAALILQSNLNAPQAAKETAFKQAVGKLTEGFISQEAAEDIIREFADALGWQLSAPAQEKPAVTQPQPQQAAVQSPPAHTSRPALLQKTIPQTQAQQAPVQPLPAPSGVPAQPLPAVQKTPVHPAEETTAFSRPNPDHAINASLIQNTRPYPSIWPTAVAAIMHIVLILVWSAGLLTGSDAALPPALQGFGNQIQTLNNSNSWIVNQLFRSFFMGGFICIPSALLILLSLIVKTDMLRRLRNAAVHMVFRFAVAMPFIGFILSSITTGWGPFGDMLIMFIVFSLYNILSIGYSILVARVYVS